MAIGTVVIDGETYRVTGLALHDGMLLITAVHHGPVRSCQDMPAAVFGDDGRGVCQSWSVTIPPEAARGGGHSAVTIVLPIRIETMQAVPS